MTFEQLIKILQASIAPVVLISGVGLLLLTLTNRFGRTIDRIRFLSAEEETTDKEAAAIKTQIGILYARARYQRTAIFLSTMSIICVSVIIFVIFASEVYTVDLNRVAVILFQAAVISLTASLVYFLLELWAALRSIEVEIKHSFGKIPK